MVNNMNQRKAINKITFNLSTISNILLGGVVLTGNYRFEPKTITLTSTCLLLNYTYIKLRKNARKN